MPDEPNDQSRLQLRIRALSRWENEGGAPERPAGAHPVADPSDHPQLSNAELVQLRVRVIALENLVISLLSQAGEPQLRRVRDMAAYISPRSGFTHHPMTLQAASQMLSLVERADQFQTMVDD